MEATGCPCCAFLVVPGSLAGGWRSAKGGRADSDQCSDDGVKLRHLARWGGFSGSGRGLGIHLIRSKLIYPTDNFSEVLVFCSQEKMKPADLWVENSPTRVSL